MEYFRNTDTLARKTLKVVWRNKGYSFSFLLSPILVVMFMWLYQGAYERHVSTFDGKEFEEVDLGGLSKCVSPSDCTTLGIFTIGKTPYWAEPVGRTIAERNYMKFGSDVRIIGEGSPYDLQRHINQNPNTTQVYLVFCTDHWNVSLSDTASSGPGGDFSLNIPCKFEHMTDKQLVFYTLVVNATVGYSSPIFRSILYPLPYNPITVKTKKEVDQALMVYFGREAQNKKIDEDFTYEITTQGYPVSSQRIYRQFDFFSMRGSFFFYMPIAVSFLIMSTELNYEKDKGIKLYMLTAGLRSGAYWMSWGVVNAVLSGYVAIGCILPSYLLGVPLFHSIPMGYFFILFFLSCFGMNCIAYLINTLAYSKPLRQAASYAFLLISFFFQIFFSAPNSCNIFYSQGMFGMVIKMFKAILHRYPGYNYTKLYADYVHSSGSYFDMTTFKFSQGHDYTWKDFTSNFEGVLPNGVAFDIPSPYDSFQDLFINIVIFTLLAWYSDNVLASNQGVPKGPLFCIRKKEYIRGRVTPGSTQQDFPLGDTSDFSDTSTDAGIEIDSSSTDHVSVKKSKESVQAIMANNPESFEGIVCENVAKIYKPQGFCRSKFNPALRGVSMKAAKGELIAILGQNGAGKTTLVNILSGYLSPSAGRGKIFGLDLNSQLEEIRDIVALCPQFDIFWEDLTVLEHFDLIYRLKNLPISSLEETMEEVLRETNLLTQRNSKISELSGGMRRRVSIGMSKIGEPKVLFLDEPTTGLDPVNQKEIVSLLEGMKKERVIVLVTHLMEEAEVLADRVLVVHKGKVVRAGDPMGLKRELTRPYRVGIVAKAGFEKQLIERAQSLGKVIIRGHGLSLSADQATVTQFLSQLKNDEEFAKLVAHWDISTASLEELFLELTRH